MPQQEDAAGLPSNVDAERSVLGAILLDDKHLATASERLHEEDFYLDSHRKIYARMRELHQRGLPIDLITLVEELTKHREIEKIGGVAYVASLTEGLPRQLSIASYVDILREKATLREVMRITNTALNDAHNQDDPQEVIGRASAALAELAQEAAGTGVETLAAFTARVYPNLDDILDPRTRPAGLASPWRDYNEMTGGFLRKEVTILAARPSMGKTACAINILVHAAVRMDVACVFFSLEQDKAAILDRAMCYLAGVSLRDVKRGALSLVQRNYCRNALDDLLRAPFYIDDSTHMTTEQMAAKAARIKAKHGALGLIGADYLGLFSGNNKRYENRNQEVSSISRDTKRMARELDVPVLMLSQLSRESSKRGVSDHRPVLSDLRESGAIEQDADVVAFVHRPEYYTPPEGAPEHKAEIVLAKQRNGPLGIVHLYYDGPKFSFTEERPD